MKAMKSNKALAMVLAVVTLASAFAVCGMSDADAADEYWTYTINSDGTVSGSYTSIGPGYADDRGAYVSTNGTNVGSWGFDDAGYGPFGSFYAAFDPSDGNRMICHLDPDNLKSSVDGKTDITDKGYNVMWCLPTVYWTSDSDGSLVLTNDPNAGGVAYAHTIDGITFPYLAIGVYEASTKTIGDSTTILTSTSGTTPLVSQTRATFRDYANNQNVDADGETRVSEKSGYAMLWNFYQYELYKYCALAVMGSWDSQSVAGNGSVYGTSSSVFYDTPGLLDTSGPYAGTIGSGTTYQQDSVKVFIENAWGSVFDFVDGIVFSDRKYIIDQSSVPTDATAAGDNITVLTEVLPSFGWGASPSTKAEIWGMPTATGGSATSGLYDYVYSSTGTRPLYVGGCSDPDSSTALHYGLSYAVGPNALSDSNTCIGGRLAFVFAADPAATIDHTVTFISNGQQTTESVSDGEAVAAPESPVVGEVVDGKVFAGWYTTDTYQEKYNFSQEVTSDLKLYARWVSELGFTSDPTTDGVMTPPA